MDVQTRIGIFLFLVVMVSSEEVKKNLTGTVGGSITLPDPVEDGFLSFERKIIALVTNRQITIIGKIYKDKLLWNNNNRGLFTITRLQKNDSGIYSIQNNTEETSVISYEITVFESVSTPAVETLNVSAESCSLQCLVEKAEETTLLWYKDKQILNQRSSSVSLPLTVLKKDFSSSYRCVAANPADQKTLLVNVTTSCSYEHSERSVTDNPGGAVLQSWLFLIPVVVFVIAVAIYIIMTNVKTERRREMTTAAPSAIN